MSIVNELGALVERVASATNRQAADVWYDVNGCDQHERGVAYAVWPLVLKRYRDKAKNLDKWLADAYGCFCAFTSIAGDADAEGGNVIKALTISAFIAGMVEALSSEAAQKSAHVEERVKGQKEANKEKSDAKDELALEIYRQVNIWVDDGKQKKEAHPIVADEINKNGWKNSAGKTVFEEEPLKAQKVQKLYYHAKGIKKE